MSAYQRHFGASPRTTAVAPGRVNLLGEHTDYNDGYVLPTAIPQSTTVELGPSPDARHHVWSVQLGEEAILHPDATSWPSFARYVLGCVRLVQESGRSVPPLCIAIDSQVPIGAGLSSSAALEVATLRALRQWPGLDLDDVQVAQWAQRAEIRFAGVQCGIMDQMASSLADTEHMLFLDTRSLRREVLPLPSGSELLVVDSGAARTLATSGYNQRRAECEAAARTLGVPALRDVVDVAAVEGLAEPLRRRARHVVTENARVLEACRGVTPERFGALMNASHASLRDDYEVSVPRLDALVSALQQAPDVYGARLTGAGFGGACVALVRQGAAQHVAGTVVPKFADAHVLVAGAAQPGLRQPPAAV